NLFNVEITSYIRFQRLLAKRVVKKELDRSKIRDVIPENNSYSNVKCTSDDIIEYAQLKNKGLNDLEIYKEQFKRKYAKSKGLKRLSEHQEGTSSYNMKLKESIVRKWSILTIVMCSIALIVITLPIYVKMFLDPLAMVLGPDALYLYISYGIICIILKCIILYSIIYIMKKVVKYHRLEAGRG
ncbi:CYIR protein, partial [Plasmodium cynomolgi strain B]